MSRRNVDEQGVPNAPEVTTEDPEIFVEELQKVFEIMHVADAKRVELAVDEEKLRDREEFKNKKARTGNESGQQRSNMNRSSFQHKQNGPAPSSSSATEPRKKGEYTSQNSQNFRSRPAQSQGSVAQGGNWAPTCAKCECPKNRQGNGNQGNNAQSSSVAPLDSVAPRGTTSGTGGGANCLYAITSHQKQENSPDVVTNSNCQVPIS
ncbi:uncharacterized protein LOC125873618 [Solanum stenotomum]|uniref:uncharacterized protein LOC125873618 n=1 Tax=Solanum stenotomum TaxID=172797 RepID=UPI0020D0D896|nr:uncharacterized protein LOC125873618 [Solanum stenotomum]